MPTVNPPPVALTFAAKSTADPHASIPTQTADCCRAAKNEGRDVVQSYDDENASAYSGNRGQGLTDAKDHAIRLAGEYGWQPGDPPAVELWVQHSDRLARGDGITADHLAEVWFALRRNGVRVRSVQDDHNLEDAIRVVLIGERNHEDSKRKAKATRDGKKRAAERGDWPGAIPSDGYQVLREVQADGKVKRTVIKDPERRAIYELHFDLALKGFSDANIALELARRDHVTRPYKKGHQPRPFQANRVKQTLTNPVYAGQRVYKGKIVGPGNWEPYVSPEDFERLQEARLERSNGGHGRGPGRPAEGYVLAGLAWHGDHSPMDLVTDRNVRQDGVRNRRYVCRDHREHHRNSPHYCSVKPIDAAVIDVAVIENLTHFLGDVAEWRERVVQDREVDRARMVGEVERATVAVAEEEKRVQRLTAEWERWLDASDTEKADAALEALTSRRADRDRARTRLQAAKDAQASVADTNGDTQTDALLDFFSALRKELAGRVDGARGNIKRLNLVLRDYFQRIELRPIEGDPDFKVSIVPVLSADAAARIAHATLGTNPTHATAAGNVLLDERVGPPPVRPIETSGNSRLPS